MADDIVIRWMNEGWVLQANVATLHPRPDPSFPRLPLVFSRGQADSYLLVSPTGGKKWVLKKFYPAKRPSASYLSAIQSLVPAVCGTEAATNRCVLSNASLQALSGAGAEAKKELGAWLNSTVLMAEVPGEGWGNIADDLRAGRVALSGKERLQIAQSLCAIVESLERANCSHRDLSSGNVFIELPSHRASLIDWDSFYHKSLPMPANTTAGTLGYIAPFIPQIGSDWDAAASWEEGADRFGLSLLIVELLITTVGSPVTGDGGIFDQTELRRRSGPGLNAIVSRVRSDLPSVHKLLMRALQATSFAGCPSAAEWTQALDKEAKQNSAFVRSPSPVPTGMGPAGASAAQFGQGSGAVPIPPSKPPVAVPIPPRFTPPVQVPAPIISPTIPTPRKSGWFWNLVGSYFGANIYYVIVAFLISAIQSAILPHPPLWLVIVVGTWLLFSTVLVGAITFFNLRKSHARGSAAAKMLLYSTVTTLGLFLVAIAVDKVGGIVTRHGSESPVPAPDNPIVKVSPTLSNQNATNQLLNASYESDCWRWWTDDAFPKSITVSNGAWDNGQTALDKEAYFQIVGKKILLANLTGDGHQVAVVHTICGQENSTSGYDEIFVIDTSSPYMKVLQRFSFNDWSYDALGATWNTSDVRVKDGLLAVSYGLGGSHAQHDWGATSAFKWDGSQFVRVRFEAHGEPGGSHPNEVIRTGIDLSALQIEEQNNAPSNSETDNREAPPGSGVPNTLDSQVTEQSSPAGTPSPGTTKGQTSATTQVPTASQSMTVPEWLTLAESQFEDDNLKGALQSCNAALQIDPHNEGAIRLKGKIENTLRILGSPATAQAPSSPQGMTVTQWLALAESQFERNDFKGALQSCDAALQVDPRNSQAIQLKGKISATMKVLGDTQ